MDHNDHQSVHLAEAKPPLPDLCSNKKESSGELWRVLESSGELWRALENSGELALESSGEFWRTLEVEKLRLRPPHLLWGFVLDRWAGVIALVL